MSRTLLCCLLLAVGFIAQAQWSTNPSVNTRLTTAIQPQHKPSVLPDGSGGAFISYEDLRSFSDDIYIQRINSSGIMQWQANGIPVCTAPFYQSDQFMLPDNNGGVYVIWRDERISGLSKVYAQHVSADGTMLWATNGIPLSALPHSVDIAAVPDGAGGFIVTWTEIGFSDSKIYAQRINPAGEKVWVDPVLVSNYIGTPVMVSDGSNGAIISWADERNSTDPGHPYEIYAQHLNPDGAFQWQTDGMLVQTGSDEIGDINIASNNNGGAIVTWCSFGLTDLIKVQSIGASGNLVWAPSGITVSASRGYFVKAILDGNGGAYLIWLEAPASSNYENSYAQYINSDGVVQWQEDGIALKPTTSDNDELGAISDDAGGVFVIFAEWITGNHTVTYLQHLGATGPIWPACVAVTSSQGWQYESTLGINSSGGVIVAWGDQRNEGDLYAQNVCGTGALGNCVLGLQEMTDDKMLAIYPNPGDGHFKVQSASVPDKIIVTDILGKTIFEAIPITRETIITIPAVSGMYFVKIFSGGSQAVKKVIVN
jgi:predicted lipoprotein with Yx(FWY)xxD motif